LRSRTILLGLYTFGTEETPNCFGTPPQSGGTSMGTNSNLLYAAITMGKHTNTKMILVIWVLCMTN